MTLICMKIFVVTESLFSLFYYGSYLDCIGATAIQLEVVKNELVQEQWRHTYTSYQFPLMIVFLSENIWKAWFPYIFYNIYYVIQTKNKWWWRISLLLPQGPDFFCRKNTQIFPIFFHCKEPLLGSSDFWLFCISIHGPWWTLHGVVLTLAWLCSKHMFAKSKHPPS